MGWQAWDAYECDADERRHSMPWRNRYSWRGILIFTLIVAVAAAIFWTKIAHAQSVTLSDAQIIEKVIQDSRNAYYATGHPCACPYDRARNGSSCGRRSAYSRPGGAEPKCYPKDVLKAEVDAYRQSHQ